MILAGLTPEEAADGRRDALIMLAAAAADTDAAAAAASAALRGHVNNAFLAGLLGLLVEALTEHGANVGEWAARKQAGMLADEAGGM
jgi:hypothetical protein